MLRRSLASCTRRIRAPEHCRASLKTWGAFAGAIKSCATIRPWVHGNSMTTNTWHAALDERDDLEKYGSNRLGLFALVLHFGLEDIQSVATDAVVDGPGDKKCDIVYIDRNERVAVVAQCYESQKCKPEAPATKASDLSTAIGWLVNAEAATIPPRLRSAAQVLRLAAILFT